LDNDNTALADNNGGETYCSAAIYDGTGKKCYMYSKGIAIANATPAVTNGGKLYIRVTTNAV